MPIRMTDDQPEEQFNDNSSGGRGGGFSGGGLISLLPLLLSLFRGKRIFLLLIILVAGYFLLGRGSGCGALTQLASGLSTGGFLDPKQFEKANIYEPLADDDSKNPLPESANLQKYAPEVGDQGKQGSCVAWSSAYAARSILESARTGASGNAVKFSPAFLYNQIGLDNCEGSYIIRAMEFMTKRGLVPYDQFPYTDQDCTRQPTQQQMQNASQFKMRGFNRLSLGDRNDAIDLRAIKENLAQGAPVVIGMMVGQSYMQEMRGKDLWTPAPGDQQMMGFGGHAQCAVGYDDKKYGGAFLIMNSWGPEWGNNGFAWVRYGDFKYFVREAYGLEPMQKVGAAANEPLTCEVGLVEVAYDNNQKRTIAKRYIPLKLNGGNVFETVTPLKKAETRFKMEVKNNNECYVYVFGKETNGTSYTLFPYPRTDDPTKTKYSPFCGIAGYRLFPKDKSMQPDNVGTKDIMAVVVSKKELNWNQVNSTISQNPGQDYNSRLTKALGGALVQNARFQTSSKGNISFSVPATENQVVACVVEIDKQ